MKKNIMMRIASVLMIAVLLTTCVISGTFAKYASTFTSESSAATVAKWAFTLGTDPKTPLANTFNFDLFTTINDTGNTADETDAADGKIAPGTAGSFAIVLNNESEVNATYKIQLNETNAAGVPIKYSINGTDWYDDYTQFNNDMEGVAINMGATATINVQWKWEFNGTSDADTQYGIANTAPTVTVAAQIIVEQVD